VEFDSPLGFHVTLADGISVEFPKLGSSGSTPVEGSSNTHLQTSLEVVNLLLNSIKSLRCTQQKCLLS
jgi:hypothetical protein